MDGGGSEDVLSEARAGELTSQIPLTPSSVLAPESFPPLPPSEVFRHTMHPHSEDTDSHDRARALHPNILWMAVAVSTSFAVLYGAMIMDSLAPMR